MGRSADDLVLKLGRKVYEVRTVAGYTDQQVPVLFRVLLGGDQCLSVDDVELEVPHFQVAGSPYERHELLRAFWACNRRRRQLHVQQPCRPLLVTRGPRLCDRDKARRRSVPVGPLRRAHALGNGLPGLPPIGCGAQDGAEGGP